MGRRSAPVVAVVGSGKAAGALAASLKKARVRHMRHVARSTDPIGAADIVVLAVIDAAIGEVARAVVERGARGLLVHMAGSLGLDALGEASGLAARGCRRGALHPLASLDGAAPIPRGPFAAVDADVDDDVAALSALAVRLGLEPGRVRADGRVRYHAGAVIAGNLATALVQLGVEQLVRAGVDADTARRGLAVLLRSTAERAFASPLPAALTGPVARGDNETIARHLQALSGADDEVTRRVYLELTRVLAERVARR